MNRLSASQDVRRSSAAISHIQHLQDALPAKCQATKLRLSLSQLTTTRWPLVEEVTQLKALGYDGIGLWRPKVAEFGEERTSEILRDTELGVSSLSFIGGFTGVNGFGYEEALDDARSAIQDAELLGAETVVVVGGARNQHTIRHSRRLVADALRELAEFAMLRGVKLSLLPMQRHFAPTWTYLHTIDETLEVLGVVNHPSVGLAFDTYHLWQEPRLMDRIPELVPLTGVVQVCDSHRELRTSPQRCLPDEGSVPLAEIVQCFLQAGYNGYFDIQVWSDQAWASPCLEIARASRDSLMNYVRPSITTINCQTIGE